jgi:hypothetical protein
MRSKRRPETIKRSELPPSCADCRPYQGRWRRANDGGLERCSCARGRALAAGLKRKRKRKPAVSAQRISIDWGKRAAGDNS